MIQTTNFKNGALVTVTDSTPMERFMYEKLGFMMDDFQAGEIDLEEAKRQLEFLVLLGPYMEQEVEAKKVEKRNAGEISRNGS